MATNRNGKLDQLFPHKNNKICRKCDNPLTGRRTSWCSKGCSTEAMIMCYPGLARSHVKKRDKGICAICGLNTIFLQRRYWHWKNYIRKLNGHNGALKWEQRWKKKGWPDDRDWWDADHIIPVVEGGGGCGLDNLRTLCLPCHKKETALLAQKRAAIRRGAIQHDTK